MAEEFALELEITLKEGVLLRSGRGYPLWNCVPT